jgi:hypothetical protein
MRKETDKIARAFYRRQPASAARTHTDGETVWLHGNRIAWRTEAGDVGFTLAGWGTVTTRERINGILETFGYRFWGVSQRNHEQWLVHHAEKMMPLDDNDSFYISDLKGMESLQTA